MSGKGKSKLTQSSKSTSSKKSRNKRDIISTPPYSEFPATTSTFSGLVLVLLFSIFLCQNTFATDSFITISLNGAVNLNLIGGNSDGEFGKSTSATASVETNNFTGYSFTVTGGNNTGALVGENSSAHTIPSIQSPLAEVDFDTSAHNNEWGFLPSHLYNGSTGTTSLNTNYQPSPTSVNSTIIDVTKSANEGDANEYTLALAARVDDQTANDHYTGTFTLAATGNATPYHIAYTDDVQNMPGMTVGETTGASIPISSQIPTKNGYIFLGWCSVPTTGDTCSGTTYQPGDTYQLDATTDNSTTLHAIWSRGYDTFDAAFAAAGKSKPSGYNYYAMQDINNGICTKIIVGTLGTLIDTRNNETYAVAKYADGHCWMRQNLNLSLTANSSVTAYNFETDSTFFYTPANTTQTTTGPHWDHVANDGAQSYGGNKDKYIGGADIATTVSVMDSGQSYEKIGILYNWAAATAQSGSAAASTTSEVATSICPKGWRLPADSGDYSFSALMGNYGLPTINVEVGHSGQLQNPLNFNRPGYYQSIYGDLNARGGSGSYWSSAAANTNGARRFDFYDTAFNPRGQDWKGNGWSIRCVAV